MGKQTPAQAAKAERIARAKRYKKLSKTMSLTEIGKMESVPISRQRVKQLIKSLEDGH